MKIISSIFLGFAFNLSAQISVTNQDFTYPLTPDTAKGREAVSLGLLAPATGGAQTWNYANLLPSTPLNYSLAIPDTNSNFPAATGMFERTDYIGPLLINGLRDYYAHDANGVYFQGTEIENNSYNISALTGGAGDELTTINTYANFGNTVARYKFPLTATSSWTNTYSTKVDFTVVVNALGLLDDTAQLKRNFTENYQVVGWGSVVLPMNLGTHDALLLKVEQSHIDSLYVNGAPADPLILAGVGLTQGLVTKTASYEMIIRGLNRPALFFEMDTTFTQVNWMHFCSTPSSFSLTEHHVIETNVFPNPSSNGEFNLEFNKNTSEDWQLTVVDLTGNVVLLEDVKGAGVMKRRLKIPLAVGTYFLYMKNEKGELLSVEKLIQH